MRGIAGQINSVKLANQLRDQGFIEVKKNDRGLFYYFITKEGNERVKTLMKQYGARGMLHPTKIRMIMKCDHLCDFTKAWCYSKRCYQHCFRNNT